VLLAPAAGIALWLTVDARGWRQTS
jgi:hypothetical protein